MDAQLVDTEMKLTSCFSELKTKIDACQGQVKDLTEELGTTRMAFGIYQKDTQAELAELRQHKSILGREVIALRKKLAEEGGNSEKSTTAHHDEKIKSSDQSTKDKNATPIIKMEDQAGAQLQQHSMGMTSQIGERASSVGSASSSSKSTPGPGSAKNDKVKRQRIFLLRHAARCDATDGNCKVSRHCAEMKCVWNHIMNDGCNDPNCNVRHCVSSRYVISHYHRNSKQLLSSRAICGAVKESSRKKEVRHSSHSI
mmetsp:Transcript_40430/g.72871  ORF Transcript_40430/g.72871 Transcript_40430/m.72871 type:complete len:256 (+) Transcript_40430:190-957(+)